MCVHQVAFAQTKFLAESDIRKTAESVVANVTAGNPARAWKDLRPLTVIPSSEFDVFEAQYGSQVSQMIQRFGKPIGYEYVRTEKVGNSLQRLIFLARHEKAPLRWVLVFYRTEKGWVATEFKFDGDVQNLFTAGG
ncbi:hypothetical protein AZ34_07210 [Hylemonella gracilis str. Niagara R]|uniref:DUF4864 domain-containing protein n=1 Tax=Hylemonella gracilis str. Niagara R TaxID=1458275 RepID=A0A016XML3_9BURK|nr:hypothetical protein AZ34_07210 [Hylemonella gracilis str. Niagara R]